MKHIKLKTPRSDKLESLRRYFKAERTPAYGDALALCRELERELIQLRSILKD